MASRHPTVCTLVAILIAPRFVCYFCAFKLLELLYICTASIISTTDDVAPRNHQNPDFEYTFSSPFPRKTTKFAMSDYKSKAFQGWRENGVLHLPDSYIESRSSSYRLRRRRQPLKPSLPLLKTEDSDDEVVWPLAYGKKRERLVLPREYRMNLMAMTPGSFKKYHKSFLRTKRPLLSNHNHNTDALSDQVNTSLAEIFEDLHVSGRVFDLFMNLPPELRLKIWGYSLPRQRLVEIRADEAEPPLGLENHTNEKWVKNVRSPTPVPAILHTCRESRAEALKYYKLTFGEPWYKFRVRGPRIYFDVSVDVLFLNCQGFPKLSFIDFLNILGHDSVVSGIDRVTKLAICTGLAKNIAHKNRHRMQLFESLSGLKALEKLICVSHSQDTSRLDTIEPPEPTQAPALDANQIDALEPLFHAKVEFGIAKRKHSREACIDCAEIIDDPVH